MIVMRTVQLHCLLDPKAKKFKKLTVTSPVIKRIESAIGIRTLKVISLFNDFMNKNLVGRGQLNDIYSSR